MHAMFYNMHSNIFVLYCFIHKQVDVIGEPFSSVIHPDDKKDFMLLLKDKTTCSHLIRMKDTLSFNTRDSGNHLWRVSPKIYSSDSEIHIAEHAPSM